MWLSLLFAVSVVVGYVVSVFFRAMAAREPKPDDYGEGGDGY